MKYAFLMGLLAVSSGMSLHAWLEVDRALKADRMSQETPRPAPVSVWPVQFPEPGIRPGPTRAWTPEPKPAPVAEAEEPGVDHRVFSRSAVGWNKKDVRREDLASPAANPPRRPSDHRIFSRAGVEWRHEREVVRP